MSDHVLLAISAMKEAGFEVGKAIPAHEYEKQGGSSFYLLECTPPRKVQEGIWKSDAGEVHDGLVAYGHQPKKPSLSMHRKGLVAA